MGYSISWLAVRGKDAAATRNELSLGCTGEHEEIPESPICGTSLSSGWYVIFGNRGDFADSQPVGKLSQGAEVITCYVEEHVMVSRATAWSDGKMVWAITHDSQQGIEHLETEGDLPETVASIRDRLVAEQSQHDDADYTFDIPVEVAKTLTTFRHDEDVPDASEGCFERLEYIKKWWQVWK